MAVVAKSEVLVALPAWLVGELPDSEDVGHPGFLLGKCHDGVADTVLLEQDSEDVVPDIRGRYSRGVGRLEVLFGQLLDCPLQASIKPSGRI